MQGIGRVQGQTGGRLVLVRLPTLGSRGLDCEMSDEKNLEGSCAPFKLSSYDRLIFIPCSARIAKREDEEALEEERRHEEEKRRRKKDSSKKGY